MFDTRFRIGVDEVGRGCLAGDVFTAGVLAPGGFDLVPGVTDSKKMTYRQRSFADAELRKHQGVQWVIARRSVAFIDEHGIGAAVKACFQECIEKLLQFPANIESIIVDGDTLWGTDHYRVPTEFRPKADLTEWTVSAASVIAKVARDHYMEKLAEEFPAYGWEKNKGYGTQLHRLALQEHGLTEHHRKKFSRTALRRMEPVVQPPQGEPVNILEMLETAAPEKLEKKWETNPEFDLPTDLFE